jgi:hypothetical protein
MLVLALLIRERCTPAMASAQESFLSSLIGQLRAEVRPEQAMEYMRQVYATDRWFTFPKFQETAQYLEQTMNSIGLQDVKILGAPADGVSQFGYWTMPLAWDVKQARLELIGEGIPLEFRVLADYQGIPTSVGMWCGPTPAGGVTAEIIEVKDSSRAAIEGLDLGGKIVLTDENPASLKWLLAKKGAIGAINTFTENPDLQDGRQWINAWGDNGWAYIKGSTPMLCFSISPRQAAFLRKFIADRGVARVRATVDSRFYSGIYPYVTGVIPGDGSGEEVLTLGHTSEQGAQDNATGVAAMMESLATLNRLITSGRLPRPRRSIRILAMGELYGSMHYIATNPERIRNTIAAICLDTPAGSYHLAGTEYTFYLNPHAAKSYADAFTLRVAGTYFSQLSPPRPWRWREYESGTDNYLGDPAIGVPTVWPYSGSGIHTHHNSEDKPKDVDPHSLRDLAVINAAYLYTLASAGEPEAFWLAEVALSRGYDQVVQSLIPVLDHVFAAADRDQLSLLLQLGMERISYAVDRESQAVLSVLRLVPENQRPKVRLSLVPLLQSLEGFSRAQSERLQAAVDRRALERGWASRVKPSPPAEDSQLRVAAGIIVERTQFGTIPLDDLPVDQREGYPAAGFSGPPVTALYWCDGHRTLADVIRLTRLELGPTDFDFVGYFRFLQKHGYVKFLK